MKKNTARSDDHFVIPTPICFRGKKNQKYKESQTGRGERGRIQLLLWLPSRAHAKQLSPDVLANCVDFSVPVIRYFLFVPRRFKGFVGNFFWRKLICLNLSYENCRQRNWEERERERERERAKISLFDKINSIRHPATDFFSLAVSFPLSLSLFFFFILDQ